MKKPALPGIVAHTLSTSTWEAERGEGQLDLQRKFQTQSTKGRGVEGKADLSKSFKFSIVGGK